VLTYFSVVSVIIIISIIVVLVGSVRLRYAESRS